MTFTQVKKFPRERSWSKREKLEGYFTEFMKLDIKAAKIGFEPDEYSNVHSAYNCLHKGAKKLEFPIRVSKRGDDIYFIRTDK